MIINQLIYKENISRELIQGHLMTDLRRTKFLHIVDVIQEVTVILEKDKLRGMRDGVVRCKWNAEIQPPSSRGLDILKVYMSELIHPMMSAKNWKAR